VRLRYAPRGRDPCQTKALSSAGETDGVEPPPGGGDTWPAVRFHVKVHAGYSIRLAVLAAFRSGCNLGPAVSEADYPNFKTFNVGLYGRSGFEPDRLSDFATVWFPSAFCRVGAYSWESPFPVSACSHPSQVHGYVFTPPPIHSISAALPYRPAYYRGPPERRPVFAVSAAFLFV